MGNLISLDDPKTIGLRRRKSSIYDTLYTDITLNFELYIEPHFTSNKQKLNQRWEDALIKRDQCQEAGGEARYEQQELDRISALIRSPEIYFCDDEFFGLGAFGVSLQDVIWRLQNQQGVISKSDARRLATNVRKRALVVTEFSHRSWEGVYVRSEPARPIWLETCRLPITQEIFQTSIKPHWYALRAQFVRFLLAYANSHNPKLKLVTACVPGRVPVVCAYSKGPVHPQCFP